MLFIKNPITYLFSLFLLLSLDAASEFDVGPVYGQAGSGQISVALVGGNDPLAKLSQRAFGAHGAYAVTSPAKADFVIKIEGANGSSALLTISSGQPLREQFRQTVSGRDLQDAVLRACDLAVQKTSGLRGFFAGKLAFVGKQRGLTEIYTSDLFFNRVRPLTADRAHVTGPSWSPEGTKLLYTTYFQSGFPDIYMIDLAAGRKLPIATFKGTNAGGDFSPDGSRIAMAISGTGNSEIYVSSSLGKNMRRLTTNKSLETSPSWSPDGSRLVFTSDIRGKPQLYEISANGGPMRSIPTNVSSYCSEPVWNPVKANLIAFTAAVGGGFQIALYDASKRKSEVLTSVRDAAVEPAWMSDGRHLVFTQRQNGRQRLMLLDSESGKISPLHNPSFGDASSASFVY